MRNIEYQDFDNNILKSNKTSVVIFYADWCEKTKSLLSDLEQLEKDLIDINFFKMDINKSKNISSRYYISILPTISIFNHEGTFAKRFLWKQSSKQTKGTGVYLSTPKTLPIQ